MIGGELGISMETAIGEAKPPPQLEVKEELKSMAWESTVNCMLIDKVRITQVINNPP